MLYACPLHSAFILTQPAYDRCLSSVRVVEQNRADTAVGLIQRSKAHPAVRNTAVAWGLGPLLQLCLDLLVTYTVPHLVVCRHAPGHSQESSNGGESDAERRSFRRLGSCQSREILSAHVRAQRRWKVKACPSGILCSGGESEIYAYSYE